MFLNELGLKTIHGDEAFYYSNVEGSLQGAILTHVDDFYIAGTPDFVKRTIDHIGRELTVSKIEEDCFRFTGLDIKKVDDGIEVSMEDYAESLEDIKEIRKVEDQNDPLTKLELKEYRKMTGKIAWLANSTRPDLYFIALKMSKNSKEATISDLRDLNQILAKVREGESKVKYEHVGEKGDLMIVGI